MNSLENYFFGPLDKKYCMLFYVFTIINFIFFVVALVLSIGSILGVGKKSKSLGLSEILSILYALAFSFIFYIQSRLLYSMCVGSVEESN